MKTTFRFSGFLLFVAAITNPAVSASSDYKIEPALIAQLTEDDGATARYFVVFGERAAIQQAVRIRDLAARRAYVVQALQSTANRSQASARALLQARGIRFTPFWVTNELFLEGTLALARELAELPEVAAIVRERVYQVPPVTEGADAGVQAVQWNLAKIGADQVWPTTAGAGITVANIDTGVEYTHSALTRQYRGYNDGRYVHRGNWYDPTGYCTASPCDTVGHGTHTMGTMAGDDGAGNRVGVAPAATWIACRGCVDLSCFSSDLKSCAQWILSPSGASPPDIVNNSWGSGPADTGFQNYVLSWRAAGIFPAFSAGNSGPSCGTATSPGDYTTAFASGATDSNDLIASFSSRGPSALSGDIKPDVTAPGVSVRSAWPLNAYASLDGTSMASPHVAGAVALLWAAKPEYRGNIEATEQLLRQTAVKLATSQSCGTPDPALLANNTYGYGRLNVASAVGSTGPVNQPPVVTISAPANGAAFACPATVAFAATASDPDNDLTSPIQWTESSAIFASGAAASRTYDCTQTGTHTITASITDSQGAGDSDSVTITIMNAGLPAAPSDLSATVSGGNVALSWHDNSANEDGFRVERKKGKATWRVIATTRAAAYVDSPGRGTYQYRVSAFNSAGVSIPAGPVTVTVQ